MLSIKAMCHAHNQKIVCTYFRVGGGVCVWVGCWGVWGVEVCVRVCVCGGRVFVYAVKKQSVTCIINTTCPFSIWDGGDVRCNNFLVWNGWCVRVGVSLQSIVS